MRILVIADVHSNRTALEAVIADSEAYGPLDETWCLGDLVGYGPDPRECIRLVREVSTACVAGNHDLAAAGVIDAYDFNANAAEAIAWTSEKLGLADKEYLSGLPFKLECRDFTLVHGSPRQPITEYMLLPATAAENFALFPTPYCLVGHTHLPAAFARTGPGKDRVVELGVRPSFLLGEDRLILNPGAVGQPRDGDARASYAILDTETHEYFLKRVAYDVRAVQGRMKQHGLPLWLIERLAAGL